MIERPQASRRLTSTLALSLVALLLGLFAYAPSAEAQSTRLTHEVKRENLKFGPALGRDLWFTMATNYTNTGGGKYYMLYVTSPNKTKVRIAIGNTGGAVFNIEAEEVVSFKIPLPWEMQGSAEVEEKAIHVWSDDADITAYLLSRNPYTSDGMYIIPSIGWGNEYVVAAYHSWCCGSGNDLPSEFCIVANQDNTTVTINPTTDIRAGRDGNKLFAKKGVPFNVTLNRGESVQYQAMFTDTETDGYDFTGTTVRSDKPVGVVGGSMCPNVPVDFPYCDHICDMIPPTRTWANTYYTAPFASRKGGDTYLVIGSKDNQTIWRTTADGVRRLHATINKHEPYFRHDITEASRWESDAPFLMAQYINSTTFPGEGVSNDGIGDPAFTIINSVEQFTPKVIFQTPTIQGGQSAFQNFVNIIIHKDAENTTFLDGVKISSAPGSTYLPVDNKYKVYRFRSVSPGTHVVESDSGVGVYIYGYGSYDSYAWTGGFGNRTFDSKDSIAPTVEHPSDCFCSDVKFADIHENASKIQDVVLDSSYNFTYDADPGFIPGAGFDKSFYRICVQDVMKEAYIGVKVLDIAGNTTTVVSKYAPQVAVIEPPLTNFGEGSAGNTLYEYITLRNDGTTDFNFTELELKPGNLGFRIDSADRSPLKPGETRLIKVAFTAIFQQTVGDTIFFGDECFKKQAIVIGNGGQADFFVNDVHMGPTDVGKPVRSDAGVLVSPNFGVKVVNSSSQPITITGVTLADATHFSFDPTEPTNQLLFGSPIPGGEERFAVFVYKAIQDQTQSTSATFTSAEAGSKDAKISGTSRLPGANIESDQQEMLDCAKPEETKVFNFVITMTGEAPTKIGSIVATPSQPGRFGPVIVMDNGQPADLTKVYPKGTKLDVSTTFTPLAKTTGTYTLKIEIKDEQGTTLPEGTVTATAITEWRSYDITPKVIDFPALAYNAAPVTQNVTVTNTGSAPITIQPMTLLPTSAPGFSVVNPAPMTIPVGGSQTVTIQFDPRLGVDSVQSGSLNAGSSTCELDPTVNLNGRVSMGGITAQGFTAPSIFSCSNTQRLVTASANSPSGQVTWAITGTDAANFSIPIAAPQPLAETQLGIPVVFTPNPGTALDNYNAQLELTYVNAQGVTSTETIDLIGQSGGITATVNSEFPNDRAIVGTDLTLPININIAKVVPTIDLATEGAIVGARLVYTFNTDLLDIKNENLAIAVTGLPGDWAIVPTESDVNGNDITIVMRGTTPLDESVTSLGNLRLGVRLAANATTTPVTLNSVELLGAGAVNLDACVTKTVSSGDFALIYECGDSTLYEIMNGATQGSVIEPVSPNPVRTGDVITFRYATKLEVPVSLVIYDALGNEIVRLVDNIVHPAGAYEIKFDSSKLTSGNFTYRFETPLAKSSNRLVVIK